MPLNEEITSLSVSQSQAEAVKSSQMRVDLLFEELTITFQPQNDGSFQLQARSALGEIHEQPFRMPFTNEEVEFLLEQLDDSTNHSMRRLRRNGPEMVMDVGIRLFYALFDGAIGFHRQQLLLQARKQGRSMRFRLIMESSKLADLPWEFLYDETRADFMGLSRYSPLIRQWKTPPSPPLGPIELPLHILIVTADVHSQSEVAQEVKLLRKLQAEFNTTCEIKVVENADRNALFQALKEDSYHIFLFIGNGQSISLEHNLTTDTSSGHTQALALMPEENQQAKSQHAWDLIHADALIEVLHQQEMLRLVHLNGPHTDWLARELTHAAPATIGIRGAVTEPAYQAFSRAFYRALLTSKPLERAVTLGRQKMDHNRAGTREWGHVVFYMQSTRGTLLPEEVSETSSVMFKTASVSAPIEAPKEEESKLLALHLAIHRRNLDELNRRYRDYEHSIPNFLIRQVEDTKQKIAELEEMMI